MRMARRVLGALATTLLATTAAAHAQQFDIGVNALWSDLSEVKSPYSSTSDVGYRFGLGVRLGGLLFISPGVHYQEEGFSFARSGTAAILEDRVGLRSVYVPLEVGTNLSLKVVGLRLSAGPTVKFVTGVSGNNANLVKDEFTGTQFGGTVNAQVKVLFLGVNAGYDVGFTNAFDDTAKYGEGKVNSWRLGLGFFF